MQRRDTGHADDEQGVDDPAPAGRATVAHGRGWAVVAVLALLLAACGTGGTGGGGDFPAGQEEENGSGQPGAGVSVTMARATWNTGYMQAAIYRQLLEELGYEVSDPAETEVTAEVFYPALARGEVDFWANGWWPLHDPFLETELFGGRTVAEPITQVGVQVEAGAVQGYLIDQATAEAEGITSMADLEDPAVAEIFDTDGDGQANLAGCNEGWGCNVQISEHIAELAWGSNVEQVVGSYAEQMSDVISRIESGEPALFYTWTPNWTVDVLTPGEDVVWLESPALSNDEGNTEVDGLEGCAAEQPCQTGWLANDIRVAANEDFLEANPAARALFEQVEIPLDDIAAQNAEMNAAEEYAEDDIADDAAEWIDDNGDQVDEWLQAARDAA